MAVRFKEPVKARKSLPLTERDLAGIARLRGETPERQALSELTDTVVVESVAEAASREADEIRRIARRRPAWAGED
jgi:hypothetical protein